MKSTHLSVPSVVFKPRHGKCSVRIPDMNVTVEGNSIVEAIANALVLVTAVVCYREDRNIPMKLSTSYDDLVSDTKKEKTPHFVHMLTVVRER